MTVLQSLSPGPVTVFGEAFLCLNQGVPVCCPAGHRIGGPGRARGRRAGARGMLRALLVACAAGLPFRAAATFLQPQCFVPVNMDGFTNDVGLSEAMWAGVAEKPGRLHTQKPSGSHFCALTPKAFGARAHHAWTCVEPRVQRKPKRGACHLGATTRGFAVARV